MFRFTLALILALFAAPVLACGPDGDCLLDGGRTYRIDLPDGPPQGAIVFAHGYRGTAAGTMRNGGLRALARERGLALIALQSGAGDWSLPNAPRTAPDEDGSGEFAYVDAVLADAEARFGISPDRLMMSGFSAGGMFVWELACHRPSLFAAFLSVSGTFWGGPPEGCAGPVPSLLHIHGETDTTVPMSGRAIGDTRQGDLGAVLAFWQARGFGQDAPADGTDRLTCTARQGPGSALLELCLHGGGHSLRTEFVSFAWDRFVAAGLL